jgi:hypothetical protein
MVLRPNNLPFGLHKICILEVLKNDFGEVHEVTFQGVERPYDSFSASWDSKKNELEQIA